MKLESLISELTLAEKAKLAGGADSWHTAAIERLGIPSVTMSDGPHGLRKCDNAENMADALESRQAVCFPSAAGTACSFNRELMYKLGETLGRECLAEGVDVILGPAVNMKRSPLCGRNFEYMSEDPYLAGILATEYVKGVQSQNVGVSVKHFAANNQEKRRMTVSAVVDERALREIYLPAFEMIVKNARPDTIMCSYNKINGVYSSENPRLLNEILRDEWGFDGFVMSDWGAVCDRVAGLKAGLDLEMPGSFGLNEQKIIAAVENGELEEEYLDKAVAHILKAVDKYTGFLSKDEKDDPLNGKKNCVQRPGFDYVEDHKTARRIARESMVLLKNEGALPLEAEENIIFIGEFAKKPRIQGGGSSHIRPTRVISAYEAVRRHCHVRYSKGFSASDDSLDEKLIEDAVNAARNADTAVIFAGLPESYESEGYDRTHMRLPQCQNRLIREVAKVQPNTIVVLHNGSPVAMPWINDVNAVLEAYLGGEAAGEAVIDLLFGVANPSGKLAETFPLSVKDTPCYDHFPGGQLTVEYRESIFTGYRYYDKVGANVLFPFGHGLSYTTFSYSDLRLKQEGDEVTACFRIRNTGSRRGAEVAQVYVGLGVSREFRAKKELKGFTKVFLEPSEEREVSVTLDRRAFSYFNTVSGDWCVEPGEYMIYIGASSRDIRLRAGIEIDSSDPQNRVHSADDVPTYFSGDPSSVPDEEFERLLFDTIPEGYRRLNQPFTIHSTLEDAENSRWGAKLCALLRIIARSVNIMGSSGMFLASVMEMPFHSLVAMSGGKLTEDMANAIVDILNDKDVAKNFKKLGMIALSSVKPKQGDGADNADR